MLLEKLGERYTFQTFDDAPGKKKKLVSTFHGTLEENREDLERLNRQGAGIFFTVNRTDELGRKAENIIAVRSLVVDFDEFDPLRSFDFFIKPSAIVESSPGKHHVYWFVNDFRLAEYTEYQEKLSKALNADPKIKDLPRVMRVPGFFHRKSTPFEVRELGGNGKHYLATELKDWIDSLDSDDLIGGDDTPEYHVDVSVTVPHDADAATQLDHLIAHLRSAGEGERNNTLNTVSYLAYGLSKADRIPEESVRESLLDAAIEIGLSEDEALTTMKSALKGAKPITNDLDLLEDLSDGETPPTEIKKGVILVRGSDVKPAGFRWIWENWLAKGKLHVLAGAPGTGKTTLALAIAALVSRGGRWPDGTICREGQVVIWSGEDGIQDTLAPRLIASGANMDNIHFINGVNDRTGPRMFDMAKDIAHLRDELKNIPNVRFLMVDPIVSAVAGDSHKNTEVRNALLPLVKLTERIDCATLGITHFTKGTQGRDPIERVTGSMAFVALARIVLLAAKSQDDDSRIFVRAKSNIGLDRGGYNYSLKFGPVPGYAHIKATHVAFGDEIEGESRDILEDAEQTSEENDALSEAKQFLTDILEDGPREVQSVKGEARKVGVSERTLRRAKAALGVVAKRNELTHRYQWEIPIKPIS